MVSSNAATVDAFLAELPEEHRAVLSAVRKTILKHLPDGYRESMSSGMIGYGIPLERYPHTYNKQPLAYIALAAQKNYYALYLMGVYGDPAREQALKKAFSAAGKKLDMGKSCLRFKRLDDVPWGAVGRAIESVTPEDFIVKYEAGRGKK